MTRCPAKASYQLASPQLGIGWLSCAELGNNDGDDNDETDNDNNEDANRIDEEENNDVDDGFCLETEYNPASKSHNCCF